MQALSRWWVSVVFLSILVAAALPDVTIAAVCEQPVATMVSVQGTVESQRVGTSGWQPSVLNDTFCPGDTIRVGNNSRAALALASEAVMRLDENSVITLQEFKENRKSLLDFIKGAGHFLSRQPQSLDVRTPYTIAGVRGTEFFIRVDDYQTLLSIFEGNVLAANAAGELNLTSGQSAVAEKGKAPVLRVVARPRDAVQWALHYPPVLYDAPPGLIDQSPESINDPRLLAQRAALLLNVGRVDAASADLERALAINPNNSDALALQSIVAVVLNDRDRALGLARKAVEAAPQSAAAWIALSYAKQAQFNLEDARDHLFEAVRVDPGNALAWARLSEIQASFGELSRALDAAEKAASLAPDLALTQTVLGFAYLMKVDIDASKTAFEKAIGLDQSAPLPRLGLGLAMIRRGDLAAGGREIEIAASLDPNNSLIRSYLGKTYYEEKRIGLDEREYQIAKELDPNDPTPWFYDAIAKQTTNRPVEALQNMEKAIELNDNRAVFRSKLLLDADLAARQSSLARIYNDLGFQQLGLVEGWKSVNTDPTNFSAHRFISDSYSALPRHEIARVSELLQSQLLQPINITPIQPALAESNLFLISSQGPTSAGFNTFNPLFNRNQATVQLSGLAAENSTWSGEGVVSAIYNRLSLSAGYTGFETDGWRENSDQKDKIANFFAQYEFTPNTSLQAEYRYRDNEQGDTELWFFKDDFLPDRRADSTTKTWRLGFRQSFTPNSIVIGSLSYQELNGTDRDIVDPTFSFEFDTDQDAYGGELQYLLRSQYVNVVAGAGYFDIDGMESDTFEFGPPPIFVFEDEISLDFKHFNAYLYSYFKPLDNLTVTIGGSGDFQNTEDELTAEKDKFNPKFGITWNPLLNTTLRGAAFRVLKRTLITDQTIEPTQVAGFNQFYDEINTTDYWVYGGAVDQKFTSEIYGGVEYTYRDLNVPFVTFDEETFTDYLDNTNWDENILRAYLFWTPHDRLAFTAEYMFERLERDEVLALGARKVTTNYLPLGVNFFHPCGLNFFLKGTYINQDGEFERKDNIGFFEDGDDSFWLVDAAVRYRFPKRYGFFTIGVKNMFDKNFEYFDSDPDNLRFQPDRSLFAKLTLAFP